MSRERQPGNQNLGITIQALMILYDIDIKELPRRTEISKPYMKRIVEEKVTNPAIDTALRIADAFEVSIDIIVPTPKSLQIL